MDRLVQCVHYAFFLYNECKEHRTKHRSFVFLFQGSGSDDSSSDSGSDSNESSDSSDSGDNNENNDSGESSSSESDTD